MTLVTLGHRTFGGRLTTPAISILPDNDTVTMLSTDTAAIVYTLTRIGGYTGTVTPAVTGLPTGVSGAWSDSSLTGADTTTTLTLTSTAAAEIVADAFTVTFSGAGVTDAVDVGAVTVEGTYTYLEPVYTLPSGMTYNSATGMVDGTVMDTTYATTLPSTEVLLTDQGSRAANRSALISAISTAAASGSGTRIRIPSGVDFGGTYTLPVNSSTGWIYLESTTVKAGTFVAEGTRVAPADATLMPQFYMTDFNSSGQIFNLPAGNGKYRFVGLECTFAPTGVAWNADTSSTANCQIGFISQIVGGNGISSTTTTDYIDYVVVDRCYLHGLSGKNCTRALLFNGRHMACIDSYFDHLYSTVGMISEGQGIAVTSGAGPYKFNNNYIPNGTGGENIFFGGGNCGVLSENIEVQRNHLHFPYKGTWEAKNLLEFKLGRYILVQGNVFEGYFSTSVGSQYYPVQIKSTRQSNSGIAGTGCTDLTLRLNELRDCSAGYSCAVNPEGTTTTLPCTRIEITGNRQLVPTTSQVGNPRANALQSDADMVEFTLKHNTLYCTPRGSSDFGISAQNCDTDSLDSAHNYQDNLFAMTTGLGINDWWRNNGTLSSAGNTGWNDVNNGAATFSGNTVTKSATLPSGNTAIASIVAADLNASTLAINVGSAILGTATAGRDPGCIHALVDSAIAGVV